MYAQSCILLLMQTCSVAIDGRQRLVYGIHRGAIEGQDIGDRLS